MRRGLRARPPAAAVRLDPNSEGDAPYYSRERYLALAARLRDAIPDLALGTDIIVGFPGETEEDFAETLAVVEEVRYDTAFTFIYSPRRGTDAAAMTDRFPTIKHERLEQLVEVVQRRARERAQRFVGRTLDVLVEGPSRTDPSATVGARATARS